MNTYRVKQEKLYKFVVEMQTAAGWLPVNKWTSKEEALKEIQARLSDENFTVVYFDMAGNPIPAN